MAFTIKEKALIFLIEREHGSLSSAPEDDFYYRKLRKEMIGTEAYDYKKHAPTSRRVTKAIKELSPYFKGETSMTVLKLINDYIDNPYELNPKKEKNTTRVNIQMSKELRSSLYEIAEEKDIGFRVLVCHILNTQINRMEELGTECFVDELNKD